MTDPIRRAAHRENNQLRIELLHPPAMYYALVHNSVPVVQHPRIENLTDSPLDDLAVTVEIIGPDGPIAERWQRGPRTLPAGGAVSWDDFHDFAPSVSALKHTDEAYPVSYQVTVQCSGSDTLRLTAPSHVLAHNEWLAAPMLYESIAAFVQPNTAAVARVLRAAGRLLEHTTGSASLEGYQSGPQRAAHIGAAVYEALRQERITYVGMPASFEETGQKIRTTAEVLADRLGNCIDLSVTYAACVEAANLRPLVWIVDGHALAGFFLAQERLPETAVLDGAQMINLVESGKAVAVEMTKTAVAAFKEAATLGRAGLRMAQRRLGVVDVALAHRSGIRPLPSIDAVPAPVDEQAGPPVQHDLSLPEELIATGAFDEEENLAAAGTDHAPPRIGVWRRALLDLSLRNPLLKLPKRGKGLDLFVPTGSLAELDDVMHAGKLVRIVAQDAIGGVHELQGLRRAQDLPAEVLVEEFTRDHRLYGAVTDAAYVRRMRGLQRDARTVEQETGANYLYLTLGSLVHQTPTGEAHAPLFLLPVRIEGGTGRKPYHILIDGDELAAPNHCLVQWLRTKDGVRIPALETPILDESGIDVVASLRAIRKVLSDSNLSYRIDETASLRLLQFSTFQMWRDLTQHWHAFLQNRVVRHLVEQPGTPLAGDGDAEPVVDEASLRLPIPADGSQMKAIAMAERGDSFVLEGPPGTGKSQTITNLIAHAITAGKTVLFVAEKQVALDVVKRRLNEVGLADFCLDVHGRKQRARSIHQQLKSAYEHSCTSDDHGWQAIDASYRARIGALQRYPELLHGRNGAGLSAWSAYHALLSHGDGPTAPIPAAYFSLPEQQQAEVAEVVRELTGTARSAGLRPRHPWRISGRRTVDGLDPAEAAAAAAELVEVRQLYERWPAPLRAAVGELRHPMELRLALAGAELAAAGGLPGEQQTTIAAADGWDRRVTAVLNAVVAFQQQHRTALARFRQEFFVLPAVDELRVQADAAGEGLFGKKKRRAALAGALRPHLSPESELHEATVLPAFAAALAAREAASNIARAAGELRGLGLPAGWWPSRPDAARRIQSSHRNLAVSRDLRGRLPVVWRALVDLGTAVPAGELRRFVAAWDRWLRTVAPTDEAWADWSAEAGWAAAWGRDGVVWRDEAASGGLRPMQRWGAVLGHTDVLRQCGLDEFRRQVLDAAIRPDDIESAYLRGVATSGLAERMAAGGLEYFDANAHEQQVADYLSLGAEIRRQLPEHLGSTLVARRARYQREAGELVRQLNSRRNRLPFRDACARSPEVVTALTPCFLMSPASVANFLEPGSITFDIVIFDEASQIRVAQAIGAMGRARSVVVVGDSKQMPPTSVMEAAHGEDTEDLSVPEDLDSILSECVESGLPRQSLTWHYRSSDESLIAFSNANYYDGKLASLPSPGGDPASGIFSRRVDGVFDRGGDRTNEVEAGELVAEIGRLLADPHTANRSIGVVTFNFQQRDLLLNLLEDSTDERIQAALARQDGEALFVKNLENVQGDERDVILFSLAFSKDPRTGLLPLNFGPLSQQGGERRLNVAITRARTRVVLFSSFDPQDIDLSRTSATGTAHLRKYLETAAGGLERADDLARNGDPRAARIVAEIANELRSRGLEVETDFGLSEFTVDLAVRAQGAPRWQVAVLLDGPGWRERPTVADRDAAPALLDTIMHWSAVVRVWLPQWIADRDAVLDRIDAAVATTIPEPGPAGDPEPLPAAVVEPTAAASASETIAWPTVEDHDPGDVSTAVAEAVSAIRSATPDAPPAPIRAERPTAFLPYRSRPVGSREQIDELAYSAHVQRLVRRCMAEVIEVEGPIEVERLARLVHAGFDLSRVSSDRRNLMLRYLPERYRTTYEGDIEFVWPEHLAPASWRGFRQVASSADRAFDEVPREEIANAMRYAYDTRRAASTEQLYRATRELLGYGRTSKAMTARLDRVRHWAIDNGRPP